MEKIKPIIKNWIESEKGKDILIVIIVILVGLSSFELGRLSKENTASGIKIEYPDQTENQSANAILSQNSLGIDTKISPIISNSAGKNFFASNRGIKYYSIGCSAGKTIKQENRVYFATGEEAQKAGYELSNSCR
ncbi:hypothetical protein HYW72_01765 [Candidatus Nomurabacteria bacterium]|nr:hypothetical protein [Candidatus Nomurabacteria bacterium]